MNTPFLSLLIACSFASGSQVCTSGRVCQVPSTQLSFFTIGDWGGKDTWPYWTGAQRMVAGTMASTGTGLSIDFTLAIGDNFYFYGVENAKDTRFQTTFEKVYHGASLEKPWYVIAGNHDHRRNVTAQIVYSQMSQRWHFPDYNYTIRYQLSDGTRVDIVMLDTILLCGNTRWPSAWENFVDYLKGTSYPPTGPEDTQLAVDQWSWLEGQLAGSSADYLFVVGHYPVWSIAEHGPTSTLVSKLKPLLHKYKVSAYLSGHDHTLQHIQTVENGQKMDYIVSGAGAYENDSQHHKSKIPKNSLRYHYPNSNDAGYTAKGGYTVTSITSSAAVFDYRRGDGTALYSTKIVPRAQNGA